MKLLIMLFGFTACSTYAHAASSVTALLGSMDGFEQLAIEYHEVGCFDAMDYRFRFIAQNKGLAVEVAKIVADKAKNGEGPAFEVLGSLCLTHMDQMRLAKFLEHYDARSDANTSTEEKIILRHVQNGNVVDSVKVDFRGGLGEAEESWLSFGEILERLEMTNPVKRSLTSR
jgi:hypothetical protein